MVRAPFFDKNGLKKGAWSQEEDDKLKAYVERYGHWNWRELPKYAGLSRCGKSCRLRWLNYLKPGVKHGNFCREEEDLIIKYRENFGNRWSLIAAKLAGRSDNEVKNYWHTHLKKKLKKEHSNLCITSDSQEMVSTVQNTEQEAVTNVPCHPILESCTSSPDKDSCAISTNCSSSEMILQDEQLPTSGNFWTEPFIEDKYTFNQDSCADLLSFRDWDLEFVSLHNYPSCEDTMYGFEFNDNGQF